MKYRSSRLLVCALGLSAALSGCNQPSASSTSTPVASSTQTAGTATQTAAPSSSPVASGSPAATPTAMIADSTATPGMTMSPGTGGTPNTNSNVPMVEGVQVTVVKAGSGEAIKNGEKGSFHYTGWLEAFESAKMFDTSRGKAPFSFQLGSGQVIPGWDKGLVGMQKGEIRRLTISPEMGYGASGAGDAIPPNATLYFEVEYLGPAQ